ncbi:MAG: phage head-tail connector protein [Eubacteriales bacterium]
MLDKLKLMLGIDPNDTDLDEKLRLIISSVTDRLAILLGGIEPPDSMDHIIMEVSIIRFNRIGSEGMASHTVEGESQQFTDNDFSGFMDEIQAFLDAQSESKRGKVRFL